ncbi:MAG TPA: hypothetical protein VMI54_12585 [Polyangiaceae bacterium]|nr:hypothetical protein [Polyangiaceae bacterium]
MTAPLRLVVYDATQLTREPRLLGHSWRVGARLYRLRGIDDSFGAGTFEAAFAWLERMQRPIGELQFWGHGKWGRALVDRQSWDRGALGVTHPLRRGLDALRERLAPGALIWFRTCETFGALPGRDFARSLADFTGATVAGHTFEIGFFQSGLHALAPGAEPAWDAREGLLQGSPERPLLAQASRPDAPSTITCLTTRLPREIAATATSSRAA